MSNHYYDGVAQAYPDHRRPDNRIGASLIAALGSSTLVLNVGAGAGSYEPFDRHIVAVDASREMLRQRRRGTALQCRAEHLPFATDTFDASMAVLTVHHWQDPVAGLSEMKRVTRGAIAILTWDPAHPGFWLVNDYFPEILEIDRHIFPDLDVFAAALGAIEVTPVAVPSDCTDGFLGAYWKRPSSYLDGRVRAAISTFDKIDATAGLARLEDDLANGTWQRQHETLAQYHALDLGYRLVVAPSDQ